MIGKIVSALFIVSVLVSGCMFQQPKDSIEKSLAMRTSSFTYSTSAGAILQVDINGQKAQLLPGDDVQKWPLSWSPNHQTLAYVTRVRPRTLVVLEANSINRRELVGPAQAIQFTWVDNDVIDVWLAHQLTHGSERQRWEHFQVEVKTGAVISAGRDSFSTPAPIAPSPDGQWALSFETTESRKRVHLLDANGKRVATVYERPANQDIVSQWSPSSRYVLFLGYAFPGVDDIHVYDVGTQKLVQVTHFAKKESYTIRLPRWSPTGEWIFFVLDSELYSNQPCLAHIGDSDLQCFEVSSKSDQFVWSLDGRYLAFLAPRGDAPVDIYMIDAVTGKLLNLTQDGDDTIEVWITP